MSEKTKNDNTIWLFIFAAIFVVGVWGLNYALMDIFYPVSDSDNYSKRGTMGDQFGAVNALFTGLALAGIIVTIIQQRNALEKQTEAITQQNKSLEQQGEMILQQKTALELQHKDLEQQIGVMKLQKEEMELQRAEFAKQSEIMEQQLQTAKAERQAAEQKEYINSLPFFILKIGNAHHNFFNLTAINAGADVYDVHFSNINDKIKCTDDSIDLFQNQQNKTLTFMYKNRILLPKELEKAFDLEIKFMTRTGDTYAFKYEYKYNHHKEESRFYLVNKNILISAKGTMPEIKGSVTPTIISNE